MSTDNPEPSSEEGVAASVRRLLEAVVSTMEVRLELFGAELEEEKAWLISTLIWAAASIFFVILAILAISAALVYFVPESWRPYVIGGLCLIYLFLAASAVSGLKKHLHDRPPPLSDTVGELKKDLQWIRSPD